MFVSGKSTIINYKWFINTFQLYFTIVIFINYGNQLLFQWLFSIMSLVDLSIFFGT